MPAIDQSPRVNNTRHGQVVAGPSPQLPVEQRREGHAARWGGFSSFDSWMEEELRLNNEAMDKLRNQDNQN